MNMITIQGEYEARGWVLPVRLPSERHLTVSQSTESFLSACLSYPANLAFSLRSQPEPGWHAYSVLPVADLLSSLCITVAGALRRICGRIGGMRAGWRSRMIRRSGSFHSPPVRRLRL